MKKQSPAIVFVEFPFCTLNTEPPWRIAFLIYLARTPEGHECVCIGARISFRLTSFGSIIRILYFVMFVFSVVPKRLDFEQFVGEEEAEESQDL